MKTRKIGLMISILVFGVSIVGMVALVGALSQSAGELAIEMNKGKADVILASANLNDNTAVSVPILYYDQRMDACVDMYSASTRANIKNRQFEWSKCGYQNFALEEDIVEGILDEEYLPIAYGGEAVVNRGINKETFKRWFSAVDGSSKSYASTINLTYNAEKTVFGYENTKFYPLDEFTMKSSEGEWVPKEEKVNDDGHNHLFTFSLGVPIQTLANGSEKFEIVADDDTWVFLDDKLVIDMGGIHEPERATFEIQKSGEVYVAVADEDLAYAGVTLEEKETVVIRVFHADRDSGTGSVFSVNLINMVPNITNAEVAKSTGGVEVAYDPANPSYVAPLGESLTVQPNRAKALKTSVVVQGLIMGALAVVVVVAVMVGLKFFRQSRAERQQTEQLGEQKLQ